CEDCCDLGDNRPRSMSRPGDDRRSAMSATGRGIGRVKGERGHVTVTLRNRPSKMDPATGKDLTRRTGCIRERCEPGFLVAGPLPRAAYTIPTACGKLPEQCKFSWSKMTVPSASH